jgi:tetratricopeptide (TPR) repeat protein
MSNEFTTLKKRAQALLDVGRYREAVPFLRKALALDPEQSEILCMLSYTHVSLEEYREALEWADKAVGMAPEEEWGHRLRSVIFMRTNKPKRALEAALVAARLSPDGLFTLSNLTEAQVCNNRMREAEASVERLLTVAPEEGLAHRTRAYVFLYQKKYEDAERSSRLALRLEPENPRALRLLGDALRGQKLLRGAVENYAESLRRAPTNAETRKALQETAMDYLGWPWGPQIVGLLVVFGLMAVKVESRLAMSMGALAVWGYGWATVRHGLQDLWADNPKFTALPAMTQAIVVDVCRTETPHYLRAAVWRYSMCCLAILILLLLFLIWRGE